MNQNNASQPASVDTTRAIMAVAYGRAPTHGPRPGGWVNRRVVCADGFTVSLQASPVHYAHDASGKAPYWDLEPEIEWPFVSFEVGNPSESLHNSGLLAGCDDDGGSGIYAYVDSGICRALLDVHGGAVGWETR